MSKSCYSNNLVIFSLSFFLDVMFLSYLYSKLVEGVVEQVLETGYEALVQSVPLGTGKQNWDDGGRSLDLTIVVSLVTVHCRLKHQ